VLRRWPASAGSGAAAAMVPMERPPGRCAPHWRPRPVSARSWWGRRDGPGVRRHGLHGAPVRQRFEVVDCVNAAGEPDRLALIEIESSERVHTNTRGRRSLRVGDENRRLGPLEAQELRYDKGE
jgi:hypothetical protein